MGIFGKKKKEEQNQPVPYKYRKYDIPDVTTREYRIFKEKEKLPFTWYERLARMVEGFLKISPGEKSKQEFDSAIAFSGLRISSDAPMSLLIFSTIMGLIFGIVLLIAGVVFYGTVGMICLGALLGYYLYKYPINLLKELRIKASAQVVLAILYMVVSMRMSPNLERALRFAASNVSGALAWDMRRLLWDMEMRKFSSAWEAMDAYIVKWKPENEEFAESLRLIRDSTTQAPDRARAELDEALNVVLEGSKTRMKHYAQELKTPVMIIHMMGIILPVLGTIMAPLAAVFMADMARPEYFILGYNVVLPGVIAWFITSTLRKRPVTFSPVEILKHPELPRKGRFRIKNKNLPILPISIGILLLFFIPATLFFIANPEILLSGVGTRDVTIFTLIMSSLFIVGAGFALSSYFYLSSFQRIKIQDDIHSIESEFELALFQLGNRIGAGVPTEVAISGSIDDLKDLKISDLFKRTLNNIRNLGMTFDQSLFDKNYGSLQYYPSKLINNIMRTVADTAKKGIKFASESMLRISSYLKNIRETQEYIRDLLEETTSSMKFQAYFLTPLITGLIVSMADIIILVLAKLGQYLESVSGGMEQTLQISNFAMAFGNTEAAMSPEIFQLIIGVYLIEIIFILGMFLTKIDKGDNRTYQWFLTSKMLIIGIVIYLIVALVASSMFGDMIKGALGSIGIIGG